MNGPIDFSRFTYRATKPSLTFYEPSNKENQSRRPSTPINATPAAGPTGLGARSASSATVVSETSDDERASMKRSCGRSRLSATVRERRRKRLSSSSGSETEGESRETERYKKSGPSFSSCLVSKRRKRSGELTNSTIDSSRYNNENDLEMSKECKLRPAGGGKRVKGEVGKGSEVFREKQTCGATRIVDICPISDTDTSEEEINRFSVRSDSGGGLERREGGLERRGGGSGLESEGGLEGEGECDGDLERRRGEGGLGRRGGGGRRSKIDSRPPSSLEEGGWLTCRRKPQSNRAALSCGESDVERRERDIMKRRERDVGRSESESGVRQLKEIFPQYSRDFLRQRLLSWGGVDEAIANMLASDGTVVQYQHIVTLIKV